MAQLMISRPISRLSARRSNRFCELRRAIRHQWCRLFRAQVHAAPGEQSQRAAAPVVDIHFHLPDGTSQTVSTESGDILRDAMLGQVDLYTAWGKVMNCGGGGSCGTCVVQVCGVHALPNACRSVVTFTGNLSLNYNLLAVQVLDGEDTMQVPPRNTTEDQKLQGKAASYRLACQMNVGDGATSGKISIRTKPK